MLDLWEKLSLVLFLSHTYCRYLQLKKLVEYWYPFSNQLNLFLEQLITLDLICYNGTKKLAHISSTKLRRLLSLVVGIGRADLVKCLSFLLSLLLLICQFYASLVPMILLVSLVSYYWYQTTILKQNLPRQVCDLVYWCA